MMVLDTPTGTPEVAAVLLCSVKPHLYTDYGFEPVWILGVWLGRGSDLVFNEAPDAYHAGQESDDSHNEGHVCGNEEGSARFSMTE